MSAASQSPGGAADAFYGMTLTSLALIALAALVVVIGILYGMRLARARHRAEDAVEERVEQAGGDLPAPHSPAVAEASETIAKKAEPDPVVKEPEPQPVAVEPEPLPVPEPEPESLRAAEQQPAPKPEPAPASPPPPPPAPPPAPPPEPQPEPVAEEKSAPLPPEPTPAPVPETPVSAMPLTTIKGLGPKVATMLGELGIASVDQIAVLSAGEAEALDAQLGAFTGRMARDRWIDQAKLLSAGNTTAYEAEFGKLG